MLKPSTRAASLALAAVLLTGALAGCIGDDAPEPAAADEDEPLLPWSSFEEIRDAHDGPTAENGSVTVQWLGPAPADDVEQESQHLLIHVVDADEEAPIEDASIEWGSWMPMMGHGTGGEEDPVHVEHGVYNGTINPSMEGEWILQIEVTLEGEEDALGFEIAYDVGEHPAMQDDEDEGEDEGEEDGSDEGEDEGSEEDQAEEPEGFEATYTDTIEASAEYEASYPVTVNSTAFSISVDAELEATLPVEEVNVTLVDPDGEVLGVATITGSGEASFTVDELAQEGDYGLDVTGLGVDAAYTIHVLVE